MKFNQSLTTMMQTKLLSVLFIASAALLISGAIQNNVMANQYSQQKQGYSHNDKMMMKPGSYAFGTIASLQNDENGNPIWIVSGLYKGSLSMNNKTQDGAATGSLPNATLNAKFNMVMTNGSAMHDHRIYNFTLTNMSMPNNSTTVFNGTATITMRQGPVSDVPLSIKAMDNNAVSIWVDPTKVQNHFGNTPIFGTIEKLLEVHK
ncbi:MAG TPA: hypothetical protein VHH33_08265 [Nitrososphaeraceae archaeon]|jgi:hypothetical protein|nr:hypothetical protein [Nitrososphaeraceae archaeon]